MTKEVLAKRYAKGLYGVAAEVKLEEKILDELRTIEIAFTQSPEILIFFTSPSFSVTQKKAVIEEALKGLSLSTEVRKLLLILCERHRIEIFGELVQAYEAYLDSVNGVGRGTVRSATALGQESRTRLEHIVEGVLKKKVILSYKQDSTLLGGLVAQVGSFVFDDSLETHLRKIHEDLNRRVS